MAILISGASGFVGSALVRRLEADGRAPRRLARGSASWDPAKGVLDPAVFDGVSAVVHLSGENIATRWTEARKRSLRSSRVDSTRLLAETIAKLPKKPEALLCASAVGIYGHRGDQRLDESTAAGVGFLAELCRDWESACAPAAKAGVRVVHLRFGVVLDRSGGALAKMLPAFKLGLGGPLGKGTQYMPWISLEDAVGAVLFALGNESLRGPVNVVAPQAVTNAEFAKALGRALGRPAVLAAPAMALKLVLGEMAEEMLLASARVEPRALSGGGFRFKHPDLDQALAAAAA